MATLITSTIANTLVGRQVGAEVRLTPFVTPAETIHVAPFLGQALYNELVSESSGSGYSAANQYLWDNYLKYVCAYAVMYQAYPHIVTQEGVQGATSANNWEYGSPVSSKQIQISHESYKSTLKAYIATADEFLSRGKDQADSMGVPYSSDDYPGYKPKNGGNPSSTYSLFMDIYDNNLW